jgi:hypothetical protein
MAKCRYRRKDGRTCQRRVKFQGQRCYQHKDLVEPPPLVRRPRRRTTRQRRGAAVVPRSQASERQREREREERQQRAHAAERGRQEREHQQQQFAEAVSVYFQAVEHGVIGTLKERAAEYISDQTMARLMRDWTGQNCVALARMAQKILDGRDMLRKRITRLFNPLFDRLEDWLAKSATMRRIFRLPLLRWVSQRDSRLASLGSSLRRC